MIFFFQISSILWPSQYHPGSNMEPPVKLRINIILDPPSFQLPSLKIPCLQKILYRSDDAFRGSYLAAQPLNIWLCHLREDSDGAINFKINVPTLKRLQIELESFETYVRDFKFEIYALVLDFFRFNGDLGNFVFIWKSTLLSWSNCKSWHLWGLGFWTWDILWRFGIQAS